MRSRLTFEEHSVDDHRPVSLLYYLNYLVQLAIGRLGHPLVDGAQSTLLVSEVDFEVVTVVVHLAALDEILHKGDGAGSVQAVADLPGDIAGLRVTHLGQELGQTGVQLLVFDFSRIQKGFYLRGSGTFAPESHQTQRGGHDDGGYEYVF